MSPAVATPATEKRSQTTKVDLEKLVVSALRRSAGKDRRWYWGTGNEVSILEVGDRLYD